MIAGQRFGAGVAVVILLALVLGLSACGKVGNPNLPNGAKDNGTRTYPSGNTE